MADSRSVLARARKKARWLKNSRKTWRGRARYRTARRALWERRERHRFYRWYEYRHTLEGSHPLRYKWWRLYTEARGQVLRWERLEDEAHDKAATRDRQLDRVRRVIERHKAIVADQVGNAPPIVNLQVPVVNKYGPLGNPTAVTGHHSAGPTDLDLSDGLRLLTLYNGAHANQGWGGIGYHFGILRDGTIVLLRPVGWKGAHTGRANTGNIGVVCLGTTGDVPTGSQAESYKWLIENAHTEAMPVSHRVPGPLTGCQLRGHNDWPGHASNACPGTHKRMFVTCGRER